MATTAPLVGQSNRHGGHRRRLELRLLADAGRRLWAQIFRTCCESWLDPTGGESASVTFLTRIRRRRNCLREVRFDYRGRRAVVTAGIEFACAALRFNGIDGAVFSVNRACLNGLTGPIAMVVGAKAWPVFVRDDARSSAVEALLGNPRVHRWVDRLALGTDERLHIYWGEVSTYLMSPALTRIVDALGVMSEIADWLAAPAEPIPLDILPRGIPFAHSAYCTVGDYR